MTPTQHRPKPSCFTSYKWPKSQLNLSSGGLSYGAVDTSDPERWHVDASLVRHPASGKILPLLLCTKLSQAATISICLSKKQINFFRLLWSFRDWGRSRLSPPFRLSELFTIEPCWIRAWALYSGATLWYSSTNVSPGSFHPNFIGKY